MSKALSPRKQPSGPWTPHAGLRLDPLVRAMSDAEIEQFSQYLRSARFPAGSFAVREGEPSEEMYFIIEGEAALMRGTLRLGELRAGDHFGEIGLVARRPRAASIVARTELVVARLNRERYDAFLAERPELARRFLQGLVAALGEELAHATDSLGTLLHGRALPRRTICCVEVRGEPREVRTGTPVIELLPESVDGGLVVAALVGSRAVSLHSPVYTNDRIDALTTHDEEGRRVFRFSVGLLLMEAAAEAAPEIGACMGPAIGPVHFVDTRTSDPTALEDAAERIQTLMVRLIDADVPFREELWSVHEACEQFEAQGWEDAARLLHSARSGTVTVASCGSVYALRTVPVVPKTGMLRDGFRVEARPGGLRIRFDNGDGDSAVATAIAPIPTSSGNLAREHESWMNRLGIRSVGTFNAQCIAGGVSEVIRVSEGFHEKRIAHIADEVARRSGVRAICVSGPSSSGKTTFIKRLKVQLQINGIRPTGLSLDDYYVNREATPRDASGQFDFEAWEAIDHVLLDRQVGALIRGERVRLARYDFVSGLSMAEGGAEVQLEPDQVLLIEGLHGLNPRLLDSVLPRESLFRVFINPLTSLRIDNLSRVSISDLRLLRRIIRDRRHRGYSAMENIARWPSVRAGELRHIFPHQGGADAVFNSSLVYEPAVLKIYAERYLLEVPEQHPARPTALRLRELVDRFVAIHPDHVPPTSLLREFIGGSGFEY